MRLSTRMLGIVFALAGINHFVVTRTYEAIMPPYIPAHREMVYISGVAEIAGGVGVLFPETRKAAGWWLIALLIAVFPANVYMATNPGDIKGLPDIPQWLLWARLPLQAVFIAWVVRAMNDEG